MGSAEETLCHYNSIVSEGTEDVEMESLTIDIEQFPHSPLRNFVCTNPKRDPRKPFCWVNFFSASAISWSAFCSLSPMSRIYVRLGTNCI